MTMMSGQRHEASEAHARRLFTNPRRQRQRQRHDRALRNTDKCDVLQVVLETFADYQPASPGEVPGWRSSPHKRRAAGICNLGASVFAYLRPVRIGRKSGKSALAFAHYRNPALSACRRYHRGQP
jgi:hypothetical protein